MDVNLDQLNDARKRVDAASDEAVQLALDAMHDHAIEMALWERLNRMTAEG